jgi:UDP-2,3-diacylglucosamine pyrophosphatase LpxH
MLDSPTAKTAWPKTYRTIFFSDVHLGTRGCQADMLLNFLKYNVARKVKIVGDFIDFWAMKSGTGGWAPQHNTIIQKILRMARTDRQSLEGRPPIEVEYIVGNHDEFWREFDLPTRFGDVILVNESVHVAADGKRYLVIHGDQFDGFMHYAKWLAHLGDHAYRISIAINRWYNVWRRLRGLPYWSFSKWLKYQAKTAVKEITRFEEALAAYAKTRGFDGVICGHIHHAEMRVMKNGIIYINTGDWVESCTAVVEHEDGRMEIIEWKMHDSGGTEELEVADDALSIATFLPGVAAARG